MSRSRSLSLRLASLSYVPLELQKQDKHSQLFTLGTFSQESVEEQEERLHLRVKDL
jgi:hypothetical protein